MATRHFEERSDEKSLFFVASSEVRIFRAKKRAKSRGFPLRYNL
jgi:hypothetical protein